MPILGVNVAIIHGGKVLLTQRTDFEVWCLPGGEVDPGESLARAAVRETHEEVGLDVRLRNLVGIYSRPNWLSGGIHVAVFTADVIGGKLDIQAQEVLEARYFSRDELPEALLLGHHQRILDALDGVCGVVRTHESEWHFKPGTTRQELYRLRDQSGMSPARFYLEHVGKGIPGGDHTEVEGKVDVY